MNFNKIKLTKIILIYFSNKSLPPFKNKDDGDLNILKLYLTK